MSNHQEQRGGGGYNRNPRGASSTRSHRPGGRTRYYRGRGNGSRHVTQNPEGSIQDDALKHGQGPPALSATPSQPRQINRPFSRWGMRGRRGASKINQRSCDSDQRRPVQAEESRPDRASGSTVPLSNFFNFNSKVEPVIPGMPVNSKPPEDLTRLQPRIFKSMKSDDNTDYVEKYKRRVEEELKAAKLNKHPSFKARGRGRGSWRTRGPHRSPDSDDLHSETSIMESCLRDSERGMDYEGRNPDVFWKYDMITKAVNTDSLLINTSREPILSALAFQQVVIVEGFTGCGKTTQVPQFILDEACRNDVPCKIIVTQPRRIAAISVATRVCEERGWKVGGLVGYQVGMSRCVSDDTRLTYVTTGVLLNLLISRRNLSDYTHIIIDEVHERDLDTDLILLVIKKLMIDQRNRSTKIILMSATLNADKFSTYFPSWDNTFSDSAIVRVTQPSLHRINEYYIDQMKHFTDERSFYMDGKEEPKLHQDCSDAACKIIEALDTMERERYANFDQAVADLGNLEISSTKQRIDCQSRGAKNIDRGAVLVFLPGLMEIEQLFKQLSDIVAGQFKNDLNVLSEPRFESDKYKWSILPLHSSITSEEQQKVFLPAKPGYRKIILATNIAESSITVPDVKYVIDFCLTKSLSCDPATNYTCLRLEWASKYQCVQRRGRCGRVSEGFCFRLVTKKFYDQMPQEAVPEMGKASLEAVVLQVKILNMGSPEEILALAIDPPKLSCIGRAVANLKEVGALTLNVGNRYYKYDGDLTYMGKVMARLPIDVRFGRLIMLGLVFGVLDECITIAAGLSTKSVFSCPFTKRLEAYMSKLEWANNTFSDCICILTAFDTWTNKCKRHDFNSFADERSWAKTYFLQLTVLREITALITEIKHRLDSLGIVQSQSNLNSADRGFTLKIAIAGAFYPNYFIRSKPSKNDYEKQVQKEVGGNNPMSTVTLVGFPIEQPGELYAKIIAAPLTSNISAPRMRFSGSKVFASFDPRGDKIGPICRGVYRSIKLRHLRDQKISFYVLGRVQSDKELEKALTKLESESLGYGPMPPKLPSIRVHSFDCLVCHVENPAEIWVIEQNDVESLVVKKLQNALIVDEGGLKPLSENLIDIGRLVIIQNAGKYHRGRVEVVRRADETKRKTSEFLVFLIDVGSRHWRTPGHVFDLTQKMIESKIHEIPARALQVRLEGIKPSVMSGGVWSQESKAKFEELLKEASNIFTLDIYSVVSGVVVGQLVSKKTKMSVNQEMIATGNAEEAEEPKSSQVNHDSRSIWRLQRYDARTIEAIDVNQDVGWLYVKSVDPPVVQPDEGHFTSLRGPLSPLEMTFSSQCRSAHMKQVIVEGNSVNCVALDPDPFTSNPCERLLVAAAVGIAHRSGNILARDTTLMPAIPGLTALLVMTFCPQLEFRIDDMQTYYTGCLSGLGLDPDTGLAVYPDHDMELVFDTLIDNDDVKAVNSVRLAMNTILRDSTVGSKEIENLRAKVRQEFMALLHKKRQPCHEELWPRTPHMWDQLTALKPLNRMKHHKERYSADVFQILRGVEFVDPVEDEHPVPRNVYYPAPF